jgi:6-phosphogluconate dehydrogenase (decarboxylating)
MQFGMTGLGRMGANMELWRRGSVIASWLLDLTAAPLFGRFASRGEDDFQNRVLSAMRFGFGGHVEKK